MRRLSWNWTRRLCLACLMLCAPLAGASVAAADGTETLGPPSIPISSGSGVVVAGTGTQQFPNTAKSFDVEVPAGATVKQVLLYWSGHWTDHGEYWGNVPQVDGDDTVSVNGSPVSGTKIGGSTAFFQQSAGAVDGTEKFVTYRADITNRGLVGAGSSSLEISDMLFRSNYPGGFPFDKGNDGAGVLVVYDTGVKGKVGVRDGSDLAFASFAPPLDATVPQTFTFAARPVARTANLATFAGSVLGPDAPGPRSNQLQITFDVGDPEVVDNPWQSNDDFEFDALNTTITIPAGATTMTVQAISGPAVPEQEVDGDIIPAIRPASLHWNAAALSVEEPDEEQPATFLIIDEDGIDNGPRYWENTATTFGPSTIKTFSTSDVNDDIPKLARRMQLRYFAANPGKSIWLWTGQVGDEGWFAPKVIPSSWNTAGPTTDGLRNFLGNPSKPYPHNVGPGLGTGSNPESRLDKIPFVSPLRAEGLHMLKGRTVCAVVYDSDISINYGPLNGSLKGENLGVVAFEVLDVVYLGGFSSSTLPRVQVTIRNANEVCEGQQRLFNDAPEPKSSSQPADIRPNNEVDNKGYVIPTPVR